MATKESANRRVITGSLCLSACWSMVGPLNIRHIGSYRISEFISLVRFVLDLDSTFWRSLKALESSWPSSLWTPILQIVSRSPAARSFHLFTINRRSAFKYTASAIAAITVFRSIAGSLFPLFGRECKSPLLKPPYLMQYFDIGAMFDALGLGVSHLL